MAFEDGFPERRNLIVISVAFLVYFLADGDLGRGAGSLSFGFINLALHKLEVVYGFLVLLLVYSFWRFRVKSADDNQLLSQFFKRQVQPSTPISILLNEQLRRSCGVIDDQQRVIGRIDSLNGHGFFRGWKLACTFSRDGLPLDTDGMFPGHTDRREVILPARKLIWLRAQFAVRSMFFDRHFSDFVLPQFLALLAATFVIVEFARWCFNTNLSAGSVSWICCGAFI